jgi:hypothetical protein
MKEKKSFKREKNKRESIWKYFVRSTHLLPCLVLEPLNAYDRYFMKLTINLVIHLVYYSY